MRYEVIFASYAEELRDSLPLIRIRAPHGEPGTRLDAPTRVGIDGGR